MAGYKYNPLLKLNLQEDAEVSPSDIQHLQEEIDAANENITSIEGDLKNKVPKFFVSIEELEVGEIGQYQGETGGDFVPGYFYKRQSCYINELTPPEYTWNGAGYLDIINRNGDILSRQYAREISPDGYITFSQQQVITAYCGPNAQCFLFSPSFLIADNLPICNVNGYDYYIFPYAQVRPSANEYYFDFDNPVQYLGNNKVKYADNEPYTLNRAGYGFNGWIGAEINNPSVLHVWLGNTPDFSLLISSDFSKVAFDNVTPFIYGDYIYTGLSETIQITAQTSTLSSQQSFVRVDTQPSLDPSDFATAAQGTKADTALQRISKGTDGDYITTTIGAKDANNQQKVSASLTIQAMSGADSTHKGVAEASDIKEYIQNNTATPQQGTNADNALQTIESGTSSDYITVTVTPKQTNEQRVGVTLTMQDINTASESAKGLLEAWNARNYIDTQVYNVSLNFFFYGVQWDENDPSPDCTRIGNMSLHAELPIQNAIIGGLLADDLTFTPFPDQSDWSGETVDGSAGQVMVQIPQYYFKSEVHGTTHKKLISQYPLAGFNEIPLMYISAEKATVDRTDPNTPKLCSVVNTTAAFRGGDNRADWDGTYRSLLGFPATNISLTQFRQYARNRAAGTAWNCAAYHAQRSLYWLFVTEYATLNSQKPYNAAKDVNGYMQGGLGPGASNWNGDAWNAYNGYNPLIPCGYMLEYGNQTAIKNYSVKDVNSNVLVTFEVNSFHGIQSPFADVWDWFDGILINVQSDDAGGISTCYVTDDPAKFSSTDFSQYRELGSVPRAENWIKAIYDGEAGDIICKSIPGSSSSYYCNYYWGLNLPTSGVSLRGVRFGGDASSGSRCGFLYAYSHFVPGNVHPIVGSRLCAFPSP